MRTMFRMLGQRSGSAIPFFLEPAFYLTLLERIVDVDERQCQSAAAKTMVSVVAGFP
jgi:hypothetical protein